MTVQMVGNTATLMKPMPRPPKIGRKRLVGRFRRIGYAEAAQRVVDDWTANRAFGELLTAEFGILHQKAARGAWYIGGAVTLIGSFGLDSVQEEVHRLLGYKSMRNDLQNTRMNNAVMVSALLNYRRHFKNNWLADGAFEFGTRRNSVSFKISKKADCARFAWSYRAKLELVANDEVVSAHLEG